MARRPVLLALCLAGLGCSPEREALGLLACSQRTTQIERGGWEQLEIGSGRGEALRRLRELGFGVVSSGGERRSARTSAELSRLEALTRTAFWNIYRGEDRPAAVAYFEPDGRVVARFHVLREPGDWAGPLRAARGRDELAAALRPLLDAGTVTAVDATRRIYRAAASEPEASALVGLAGDDEWDAGRGRWWGHQAVRLTFDGERLIRIRVDRVLFLH
jgi:hypothetical protein